ncbi:MAG: hypothetical protein JEZ09_02790 [Salinivirgaceae bacterium]|nr:hypothetical protein [Salinivirgaceae bacterium]
MLKSINFQLLSSNLLMTFSKHLLALVDKFNIDTSPLQPFITECSRAFEPYTKALEGNDKNPFTEQLANTDSMRDNRFLGLRHYIMAYTYSADEDKAEAAQQILDVIRLYGFGAYRLGYKDETAVLNKLVSDLKSNYTAKLELISATEWLNTLESAQASFEQTQQESNNAASSESLNISQTRPTLEQSIRNLLAMVELQASVLNNEEMQSLTLELNEHITNSMSSAKAEATRKANQTKTETIN